jgi:hypothetical protein
MTCSMRSTLLSLLCFALTIGCAAAGAAELETVCPTLPQFQSLTARLTSMDLVAGLTALNDYAADPANDNPNGCEGIELDRLVAERERHLVALAIGGRKIAAGAAFNCDALQGRTLACNGVTEDLTAHPLITGTKVEPLDHAVAATLVSTLPGMTLQRLYLASTGGLLDGTPPNPLHTRNSSFRLDPASKADILIAIFRGPPPWHTRKFVWYFDIL